MSARFLRFSTVPVVLTLLLPTAFASTSHAQAKRDTAVVVNWAALHVDHRTGLRSGQDILIKIRELGGLCYQTDIRITQNGSVAVAGKLVSMLQKDSPFPENLAEGSPAPKAATETPALPGSPQETVKSAEAAWNTLLSTLKQSDLSERPGEFAASVKRNVSDRVDSAASYADRADKLLKEVAKHHEEVDTALARFSTAACPAGERGRGPSQDSLWRELQDKWNKVESDLHALGEAARLVDSAEKNILAATTTITAIRTSLDPDQRAYLLGGGANELRKSELLAQQVSKLLASSKEKLEILKKARKAILVTKSAVIQLHSEPDSTVVPVHVRNDSEELVVTISATGRTSMPTAAGRKFEDKLTLPVLRRRRYFESVGPAILFGGNFPRYVLVNQLDPDDPTKTRSAYADKNGGHWYAVAPTIFGHMTLTDSQSETTLLGSLGLGTRTTAGGLRPDFFLGVSLGFGDRFVATLGTSFGWREEIMDEALLTGPIPSEITPESAIRTRIRPGLAFALSFRP